MPEIKVLQHDEDSQEAIVEIAASLHEAEQAFPVSLNVFCHPISLPINSGRISLLGFLVTNIVSTNALQTPVKTNNSPFSYRLFARVLDAQSSRVRLGDIDIVLDCPIPKDIPNHSYISFDVARLDLQH